MSQATWETAMGMRGYVGSPRAREDRAALADVIVAMMEAGKVSVMVPNWRGKRRHLRIYKDGGGFYVRTGKRGTCKEYITSYRKISDAPFLCEFSTAANGDPT